MSEGLEGPKPGSEHEGMEVGEVGEGVFPSPGSAVDEAAMAAAFEHLRPRVAAFAQKELGDIDEAELTALVDELHVIELVPQGSAIFGALVNLRTARRDGDAERAARALQALRAEV